MPNIPLPTGIKGIDSLPRTKERLTNLFHTGSEAILRTPGVELRATGIGVCRGEEVFKNLLYQVSGDRLISIDEDFLVTNIGEIQDITKRCEFTVGTVFLTITVVDGKSYSYDGSTLLEIDLAGSGFFPLGVSTARDVEIINKVNVYVPSDGGKLAFSNTNDPNLFTFGGNFEANLLPDINTGVMVINNDLYAMGEDSIEVFRVSVQDINAEIQFVQIPGAAIQVGYVSGKVLYKDTFAFLGRVRRRDYGFHITGQGKAPKISNPAIDEILNNEYTPEELETCIGDGITWKGYDLIKFRLARHTFYFLDGRWGLIQSGVTPINETATWNPNYVRFIFGKYFVGDATNTNIGTLEDINLEYILPIMREMVTFLKGPRGNYFSVGGLWLDCLTGVVPQGFVGEPLDGGTVGLAISNNAFYERFGLEYYRPLGEQGEYGLIVSWNLPGGLGDYESFMGIRIVTTANVDFSTEGLRVDFV